MPTLKDNAVNYQLKDPDAVLDYVFDWSAWLGEGETISSYTLTVPDGLTKDSDAQADGRVTAWLSGGTAGQTYPVQCRIVTNNSPLRTDERTVNFRVLDR